MIIDKELNELSKQKNNLIILFDNKKIEEEKFLKEKEILEDKIRKRLIVVLELDKQKNEVKNIIIPSVEEKKVSVKETKEENQMKETNKKESNCSLITKALSLKSLKDVDSVVNKVLEQRKLNKEKLKRQVVSIIYNVKKKNGRWAKYTWDEDAFLLTPKE